ncbi:exostosin-2 [Fopius arisanus]|uniref:Exostosin-2 n=1 Tax=Fopius arisanus TaxID=64838 RepID=A0A0C9QQG9_9HYME|nr:PREDICTED: exostosin-2 [Fopius arisanus]
MTFLPKSFPLPSRPHFIVISLIFTLFILSMIFYQILLFTHPSSELTYHPLVLGDLSTIPTITLTSNSPTTTMTNISCTHFTCFNIYRCGFRGNKLLVYVYPPRNFRDTTGIQTQMSREYYEYLSAIISSPYYTPNPKEACLFVPSLDTLNQNRLNLKLTSQSLKSLDFWNNGENHLILNMIPGGLPDYNSTLDVPVGRAMLATGGPSSLTFRSNFDISIPVFSPAAAGLHQKSPERRKHLVMASQMNINLAFEQDLMEIAAGNKELLILGACLHHNPMSSSIRCLGEKVYKYPDILQTSNFCLVIRGARLGQSVLMDSLASGCIPVIIEDSIVMPFAEVIDWRRAAVFIREVDILTLTSTLKSISPNRVEELRRQCYWLWRTYFSSMEKITTTMLDILSDRVFPHLSRDYNHWNVPDINKNPLFLPITAPKIHGFTAVILTYDRVELLFSLIDKIVQVPSLSKVLVIWNNQRKDPPPPSRWPKLSKPLQVIKTKENKLSNRFYPYEEIETEAVLSIDDDIIMLTSDEVEFAYEVWREFPDRIVGFPSRTHNWDNSSNLWKYESEWTNRISMVLTGAAFHHKYWSYLYTTSMPGDIKSWVDEHMNCEDIAMNFLVANVTGKAPIKVTPKKKFRCPECTNTEMLSADLAHMAERTQCINRFSRIYHTMPLKSAEFRADPVLFKDVFPEKLKRFNGIGSL